MSRVVEYTIKHPNGHIEEIDTATMFGPTTSLEDAKTRLYVAESDCLCSDENDPTPHEIVMRTVTTTDWWSE